MSNGAWQHLDKSHKENVISCSKNPIVPKLTIDENQKSNSYQSILANLHNIPFDETMHKTSHNKNTVRLINLQFSVQPKYFAIEGVECRMKQIDINDELMMNDRQDAVCSFRWKINQ